MSFFRNDKTKKALLPFGQDEAIFKQYILLSNCWFGPDGDIALCPKSDGFSMMISAFKRIGFWN